MGTSVKPVTAASVAGAFTAMRLGSIILFPFRVRPRGLMLSPLMPRGNTPVQTNKLCLQP